jgi:inositol phosphorylceramide mannosyltransferase catalytic subunit
MTSKIPAILHQTWRTTDLPIPFANWRAGWIERHPNWEHRLYDDDAIHRTIADRAPGWLPTYDTLPRMIQRVDFFRYLIVYLDGGMYVDVDMISYLPCEPLLEGASCVLGIEIHLRKHLQAELDYRAPWQVANFIFAAAPEHPLLGAALEDIARNAARPAQDDERVQDITGPRMLTRIAGAIAAERNESIRILPQINWNAPWAYPRIGSLAARIYARHACLGSWRTEQALARRLWRGVRYRLPNPFAVAGPEMP